MTRSAASCAIMLRQIQDRTGWVQAEIARRLGWSQSMVSRRMNMRGHVTANDTERVTALHIVATTGSAA